MCPVTSKLPCSPQRREGFLPLDPSSGTPPTPIDSRSSADPVPGTIFIPSADPDLNRHGTETDLRIQSCRSTRYERIPVRPRSGRRPRRTTFDLPDARHSAVHPATFRRGTVSPPSLDSIPRSVQMSPMSSAIRITYRHVTGCLFGDCPSHSATIRKSSEVDSVIRALTEQHSDFPIEIEGIEDIPLIVSRGPRPARNSSHSPPSTTGPVD